MALLYLFNDIVQKSKDDNFNKILASKLETTLPHLVAFKETKEAALGIFDLWFKRSIFPGKDLQKWKLLVYSVQSADVNRRPPHTKEERQKKREDEGLDFEVSDMGFEVYHSMKTYRKWIINTDVALKQSHDIVKQIQNNKQKEVSKKHERKCQNKFEEAVIDAKIAQKKQLMHAEHHISLLMSAMQEGENKNLQKAIRIQRV